jgi:serine/threonine protein kinase
MIATKYVLGTQIGTGSFGSVHRGKNVRTGEEVAIKMEPRTTGLLANEARIYRYLMSMNRIPKMRWFGTTGQISFLVLDLLGDESLSSVCLTAREAIECGLQMIDIIEDLHSRKLIHRDIKPANFVFGRDSDDIYLVDFGFCRSYEDANGIHVAEKTGKSLLGTLEFASHHVRQGIEPSRRDDMWSIAKTIEYICNYAIKLTEMKQECHNMEFNASPFYGQFREMLTKLL